MQASVLRTVYFFLIIGLFFQRPIKAQEAGFRMDANKGHVSLYFKQINNLIIVPIELNDSLRLNFILDTGVRSGILFVEDSAFLKNQNCRQLKISGLGQAGEIPACIINNAQIRLSGVVGKGLSLIVLDGSFLNLESHLGYPVHGILGSDFFNHFVVKIDYVSSKISIYEKGKASISRKYQAIPLQIESGRPYFKANFVQETGNCAQGSFLMDTGASHGILLEPDEQRGIHLPSKTIPTVIGWGLSGQIDGLLGRISQLCIGPYSFSNAIGSFVDFLPAASPSLPDRIGSIGGEILSRFTLIIDYQGEMLYLQRNFHYKRRFDHDMSGMEVVLDKATAHSFRVAHVLQNSPAAEAGIEVGDQIVALNRKGSGQLSLEEIQGALRVSSAEPLQLVILRNRQYLSFSLRLRRLI